MLGEINRNAVYDSKKPTINANQLQVLRVIASYEKGLARHEIAKLLSWPIQSVTGRVTELLKAEMVKETGEKRVTDSGSPATVIAVTALGRNRLAAPVEPPKKGKESPKAKDLSSDLLAYIRKNPPASKWDISSELAQLGCVNNAWPQASATEWKSEINRMVASGDLVEVDNTIRMPEQVEAPSGQLSLF